MQITVEATVPAPVDIVWRAYTTPDDIKKWNAASDDWHTTAAEVDLRVGGKFASRMEAKDGSFGFDFAGTYTNIVTNELIEYSFGDRKAGLSSSRTPQASRSEYRSNLSRHIHLINNATAGRRSSTASRVMFNRNSE